MNRRVSVIAVGLLLVMASGAALLVRSSGQEVVHARWSGARTADGGRDVIVAFPGGAPYNVDDPCSASYVVRIRETRTEVGLRIGVSVPPDPRGRRRRTAGGCGVERFADRTVTARLARPLDGRRLVDDVGHRSEPVYDGVLLATPTWMPAGWRLQDERPVKTDSNSAAIDGWSRLYAPDRQRRGDGCEPAEPGLLLTQSLIPPRDRDADERSQVHGATAVYSSGNSAEPTLSWSERGQAFEVSVAPGCADDPVTPADVLVRFARGVR
jgi:hypothetical protein